MKCSLISWEQENEKGITILVGHCSQVRLQNKRHFFVFSGEWGQARSEREERETCKGAEHALGARHGRERESVKKRRKMSSSPCTCLTPRECFTLCAPRPSRFPRVCIHSPDTLKLSPVCRLSQGVGLYCWNSTKRRYKKALNPFWWAARFSFQTPAFPWWNIRRNKCYNKRLGLHTPHPLNWSSLPDGIFSPAEVYYQLFSLHSSSK